MKITSFNVDSYSFLPKFTNKIFLAIANLLVY